MIDFEFDRLQLDPGDILVVTLPVGARKDRIRDVFESVKAILPDGTKALIRSDNIEFEVLRNGETMGKF